MKLNVWLPILAGVSLVGGGSVYGSPEPLLVYPTEHRLLDATAVALVQPVENTLIPTANGTLINQTDAVFVPTTAPLLNPLAAPLVATGVPNAQ